MQKHLYVEQCGAPAEERLEKLIIEAKSKDALAPVTVVVPSQYSGISLRRILSQKKGLINVRFMVLPRLAEYLGSPLLSAKGKSPLSPIFESAAIQSAADTMSKQQPLGDIAKHPQLHQSLLSAFRELDGLSSVSLDKLAAADPLRSQMINWYRAVRSLTAKYYTREELSREAVYALNQTKVTSALSDLGVIIFYLVSDLSPSEIDLAAGLYKSGHSAVIVGHTGEEAVDNLSNHFIQKLYSDSLLSKLGFRN